MIDFWKRVKKNISYDLNQSWLCDQLGVATGTMSSWITHDRIPKADIAARIARILGVTVEYLIYGEEEENSLEHAPNQDTVSGHFHTPGKGEYALKKDDEIVWLPVLGQRVSAGFGQELAHSLEPEMVVPVFEKLVPSYDLKSLRAVEVRGDSMTGINLFDGDIVIYKYGYIQNDGVYVLTVNGEALVKRIEFDPYDKVIKISSENPRYPDVKVIPADNENVHIEGKVVAWFHRHPY